MLAAMPAPAGEIAEHTAELGELPVFWRSAPAPADQAPPLYLHGVPTNCDDFSPFLARSGGFAVDLLGFGRSGKPGYLTFTIAEYEGFLESYLELIGVERVQLVMHDWGAVGLAFAQRHPERVEKLVLIDTVPFLPGFHWHPVARIWRTPVLGELAMGVTTKFTVNLASRLNESTPGYLPKPLTQSTIDHFDHGTQRAILRLYRGAPPEVLAEAGSRLAALSTPTLVVWGGRDPYIPARFGRDYAEVLRNSELAVFDTAGHWPWLDEPRVIDRVVEFLGGDS
jgi:pimeloyl-ACP methyl ester carboxylesterase